MNDATQIPAAGAYRPDTPWRPWRASLATLIVVALSIALPIALVLAFGGPRAGDEASLFGWGPLVLSQLIMALGAVWLAGRYQGRPADVLALRPGAVATPQVAFYFMLIALTSLAYTFLIYGLMPDVVRADMDTFRPLVHSRAWPIYALIIVVGAPLSEELLFRGFLQSALAQSRLGYAGASVVTTVAWTLLHFQYSRYGLAEIVVVGLFFCWVLWRTGTLWTTILMHALYNGAQFIGMRFSLFPWT